MDLTSRFIGGLSNNISRSLSTKLYQRVVLYIFDIGECPMSFQIKNKKNLLLEKNTDFIHGKCMWEGVGEDSRHGALHVDIYVETCIFLLNVCGRVNMALHVHLGGE